MGSGSSRRGRRLEVRHALISPVFRSNVDAVPGHTMRVVLREPRVREALGERTLRAASGPRCTDGVLVAELVDGACPARPPSCGRAGAVLERADLAEAGRGREGRGRGAGASAGVLSGRAAARTARARRGARRSTAARGLRARGNRHRRERGARARARRARRRRDGRGGRGGGQGSDRHLWGDAGSEVRTHDRRVGRRVVARVVRAVGSSVYPANAVPASRTAPTWPAEKPATRGTCGVRGFSLNRRWCHLYKVSPREPRKTLFRAWPARPRRSTRDGIRQHARGHGHARPRRRRAPALPRDRRSRLRVGARRRRAARRAAPDRRAPVRGAARPSRADRGAAATRARARAPRDPGDEDRPRMGSTSRPCSSATTPPTMWSRWRRDDAALPMLGFFFDDRGATSRRARAL